MKRYFGKLLLYQTIRLRECGSSFKLISLFEPHITFYFVEDSLPNLSMPYLFVAALALVPLRGETTGFDGLSTLFDTFFGLDCDAVVTLLLSFSELSVSGSSSETLGLSVFVETCDFGEEDLLLLLAEEL